MVTITCWRCELSRVIVWLRLLHENASALVGNSAVVAMSRVWKEQATKRAYTLVYESLLSVSMTLCGARGRRCSDRTSPPKIAPKETRIAPK